MSAPAIPEPRLPAADASLSQIREAAEQLRRVHAVLHHPTERAVRAARLSGQSWATIGRQLGISRQGARQRFGYLDELPVSIGVRVVNGRRSAYFACELFGLEWRDERQLELDARLVVEVEA